MDDFQFVIAAPQAITVFRFSADAVRSAGSSAFPVDSAWTYLRRGVDSVPYPLVGPIVPGDGGSYSFDVCFGGVRCLVSVSVVRDGGVSYVASERRIIHSPAVAFGVSRGFRVGVLRRSFTNPMLRTFSLAVSRYEVLPLFYAADCSIGTQGSVPYCLHWQERLQPGSLQVDEEQGRILFVVRYPTSSMDKLVILELV